MRLIIGNLQSPANPLLRALYFIIGVVVFGVALFFGAIFLAFLIGFVIIVGLVGMARFWWLRHKLRSGAQAGQFRAHTTQQRASEKRTRRGGYVIEGEYSEIRRSTREREEPRDRDQ